MPTFIKPCHGYLNSLVGLRTDPKTGKANANHRGADYTSHSNNSIYASAAGKIRFVDTNPNRTGFGRYLIITHDNGYETLYAHLASISVKLDQRVNQGQVIGIKGTSGKSTGVHLHFEMSKGRWNNQYTTNINPIVLIDDPEIRIVQSVLNKLGFYKGAIDGKHGDSSITALEEFQRQNGIGADGIPGRGTMAVILKEKERIESKDWIEYGDRSPDVETLTRYLNKVGIETPIIDFYNAEVKRSVMKFQESRGLVDDGVYGQGSKAEMNKALKEGFTIEKPTVKPATNPKEESTVAEQYKKDAQPSKSLAPEFKEAVKAGITDGTYPQRPATREEVAVMVYRAFNKK